MCDSAATQLAVQNGMIDGTIDIIKESYRTLLQSEPEFRGDSTFKKDETVRCLFYCCTFNIMKKSEEERTVPYIWKLAGHKIDFVHAQLEFGCYVSCILHFLEQDECPKPAGFVDTATKFFVDTEPMEHTSKQLRSVITDFLCAEGGVECCRFVMDSIHKSEGVRHQIRERVSRAVVSGGLFTGPSFLAAKLNKSHACYIRTLQLLWSIHGESFAAICRRLV